jgi:xanthine dehydrogenase accessory factor
LFDLAAQVLDWQTERRPVLLARVVSTTGMGSTEPADAMAFTEGAPPAGRLLSGAVDDAIADAVTAARKDGGTARVVDIVVGDREAHAAGLTCGGHASVLLQPADDVPETAWRLLARRAPVCLRTDLDEQIGRTTVVDPAAPGAPEIREVLLSGGSIVAVVEVEGRRSMVAPLWPTPRLVVVGEGQIADALTATSRLMGWAPDVVDDRAAAVQAVDDLGPSDGVIVLSHDAGVDAPALQAALSSGAGYVAGLGSRHKQAERAQWLTDNGVSGDEQARIHGPAGLDIGARTPAEIAVAVVAEMVAVRAGAPAGFLSQRGGPIHP